MSTNEDNPTNRNRTVRRAGSRRRDPPVIDDQAARDLVSSLFFGVLAPPESASSKTTATETESSVEGSSSASLKGKLQDKDIKRSTKKSPKQKEDPKAFTAKVVSALRIHEHIPNDPTALQQKQIYQSTYKLLQWQRDNYLVGKDYADWRKAERQQEAKLGTTFVRDSTAEIAVDPSAAGHAHIAQLGSDFIPSTTVRHAALPLVASLPHGVLYQPTHTALVDLIQGQQDNLNEILRTQVLHYLKNPGNRVAIKNSTQGFIATQYPSIRTNAVKTDPSPEASPTVDS